MSCKRLMVICALDSHIKRVERLIDNLQEVFGNKTQIAIATFGASNVEKSIQAIPNPAQKYGKTVTSSKPSVLLKKLALERGILYYDAPRQDFIPVGSAFHCCELLGEMNISNFFYGWLGYDLVYVLHSDLKVEHDFLSDIESLMVGNWSFIVPERLTSHTDSKYDYDYYHKKVLETPANSKNRIPIRASQECFIFNKDFLKKFYETYWSEKAAWDELFHKFSLHGDVSLYDIAQDFLGFNAVFVKPFLVHDLK